jgi:hypothetical protein
MMKKFILQMSGKKSAKIPQLMLEGPHKFCLIHHRTGFLLWCVRSSIMNLDFEILSLLKIFLEIYRYWSITAANALNGQILLLLKLVEDWSL